MDKGRHRPGLSPRVFCCADEEPHPCRGRHSFAFMHILNQSRGSLLATQQNSSWSRFWIATRVRSRTFATAAAVKRTTKPWERENWEREHRR